MDCKPVILLEFNELTPRLMDNFITQGALPNFKRLREESHAFITDAGEDAPFLEPWIQWIDAHTGVPYRQHGVQYLGDAASASVESIWDCLSKQNRRVWICGSMNSGAQPGLVGDILPDPWSVNIDTSSTDFAPYLRFVRAHVLEHTRTKIPLSLREQLAFAWFLLRHGLRFSTAIAVAKQLLSERTAQTRWRRASILDRLQFDLFRYVFAKRRPLLATFFINSTAHYQHVYWRNMEPQVFGIKPSSAEQAVYEDAILFGYQQMDRIVGDTFARFGGQATIVLMTALSQQPCLKYEAVGGKTFYRPVSYRRLLEFAGIEPGCCEIEPVMSEQFHVRCATAADAAKAQEKLLTLRVNDRPAIRCFPNENGFVAGCAIFEELPSSAVVTNGLRTTSFGAIFYHVDLSKSGMHDRPGLLWIRAEGAGTARHAEIVPLEDVAPTILGLLQIDVPGQMRGRNLLAPRLAPGTNVAMALS